MDEDEGGGGALKKKKLGTGEVDFKEKAGTAWSHNFLNQKPWHPLSYPNQRRKWIAEQTDAQKQRRAEEVAREFAQEQEFFRQSALISKKEKEKVEVMKAVSFMYVRPPGYNAESAKAAELEDERRRSEGSFPPQPSNDAVSVPSSMPPEDKKKLRPKDVFGRTLPTEEEFEVLKNAPRMETGLPARVKPFGIEVRNVKCLRCGNYGHQSGDRECPLRDAIMPNEENRLKRDDPLTSIMAHTDTSEPLKWELKQKPGMSPPRGGFKPDDPNQQIVAEDIFDEYGGFLSGGSIPDLLTNFSVKKSKKHSKHKTKPEGQSSAARNDSKVQRTRLSPSYTDSDREKRSKKKMLKEKHKRRGHSASSDSSDTRRHNRRKENKLSLPSSPDDDSGAERCRGKNRHRRVILPDNSHHDKEDTHFKSSRYKHSISHDDPYYDKHRKRNKRQRSFSSDDSESDSSDSEIHMHNGNEHRHSFSSSSDDDSEMDRHFERNKHRSAVLQDSPRDRHHKRNKHRLPISSDHAEDGRHRQRSRKNHSVSPDDSYYGRRHKKDRRQRSFSPDCSDSDRYRKRSKHDNDPYYEKDRKRDKHQLSASSDDAEYSRHHERHKHRRRHHGDHHRSHKSD